MTKYNVTMQYRYMQSGDTFALELPNMTADQVTCLQSTVGTRTGGVEVLFSRVRQVPAHLTSSH